MSRHLRRWVLLALTAFACVAKLAHADPKPNAASISATAPVAAAAPADPAAPAPPPAAPAAAVDPDAPTVAALLEQSEALVGDVIILRVTAVGSKRVPVNLPAQIDLSPFEIIDRKDSERDLGDGKTRREFVFHIAAFETGSLTVPSLALTYLAKQGAVRTVSTEPLQVTINSVLANEPDAELKANAEPVPVMQEVLWPVYALAGLAAALLGAFLGSLWLRRRRQRAKVLPVVPPRPPHEVALARLHQLGATLPGNEDLRTFYFGLSEVLREYFGARYGFDSLELTTDELLYELRRHGRKPLILSDVQGWLAECDLVKFARVSPTDEQARAAFEAATVFVTTTRPPPPVVAEPTPAAGGARTHG